MKKIILLLAMLLAFAIPVSASVTTDAKKAYKKYMGENGVVFYAYIYFDNDSVPELLIDEMGIPSLYTYKNQTVTPYKYATVNRYFEVSGYYKKKGCLVQQRLTDTGASRSLMTTYWTSSGTAIYNKLQKNEVLTSAGKVQSAKYTYNKKKSHYAFMGKTKIKKASFTKKLKAITNGRKLTKISWKRYKAPKLNINRDFADLDPGETVQLRVSGISGTVKWTSDDKYVATVSSKGLVTGKNPGTAVITAVVGGSSAYCVVTVREDEIKEYVHDDEWNTDYIATIGSSFGGEVSSITAGGNVLTIYGGVCHPDREGGDRVMRNYFGVNKFYLTSKTEYSYEDYYSQGTVSKDVFMAYFIDDFLENRNDCTFLYIFVEDGVVTSITVSCFEPQVA